MNRLSILDHKALSILPSTPMRIFTLTIITIFFCGSLLAQPTKRDTVWIGYDRGRADSLITYTGQYIGMQYAHAAAGWQYAMKIDLREFGTNLATNDFYPWQMMFNVFPSAPVPAPPSGSVTRAMTAYVWEDSLGFPGKILSTIPFSLTHYAVSKETLVVLTIPSAPSLLRKKNPLWFGFEEGPTTTEQVFTWMRSCYLAGSETRSHDRRPGGRWSPITQPNFAFPELRSSYNLFFRARYIGDSPLDVDDPLAQRPSHLTLGQNYPNPFSSTTSIPMQWNEQTISNGKNAFLSVAVFDMLGERVATVFEGVASDAPSEFHFSPFQLASGVYRYVVTYEGKRYTKTMTLLR